MLTDWSARSRFCFVEFEGVYMQCCSFMCKSTIQKSPTSHFAGCRFKTWWACFNNIINVVEVWLFFFFFLLDFFFDFSFWFLLEHLHIMNALLCSERSVHLVTSLRWCLPQGPVLTPTFTKDGASKRANLHSSWKMIECLSTHIVDQLCEQCTHIQHVAQMQYSWKYLVWATAFLECTLAVVGSSR